MLSSPKSLLMILTSKWWFLKPLWQAGRFEDKWGGFVGRYVGRWIPDGKEIEGCLRQGGREGDAAERK